MDLAAPVALLFVNCRGVQAAPKVLIPEETASADPDNVPPRSRLFLVVPKTAEARIVHVSICNSFGQQEQGSAQLGFSQVDASCSCCNDGGSLCWATTEAAE